MLKAHRIQKQINDLYKELRSHQERCQHKKAEAIYQSDTGNYSPSDDSFWVEVYCPTCLKCWTIDSDRMEYRINHFKKVKEFTKIVVE